MTEPRKKPELRLPSVPSKRKALILILRKILLRYSSRMIAPDRIKHQPKRKNKAPPHLQSVLKAFFSKNQRPLYCRMGGQPDQKAYNLLHRHSGRDCYHFPDIDIVRPSKKPDGSSTVAPHLLSSGVARARVLLLPVARYHRTIKVCYFSITKTHTHTNTEIHTMGVPFGSGRANCFAIIKHYGERNKKSTHTRV